MLPERSPRARRPGEKIGSHFDGCFGCGGLHPTGLHLVPYAGPGLRVAGTLELTLNHQGAAGLAHGGLLAAVADEAMGALNWLLMAPAVTARLEVDYLRPVPVGQRLGLAARITGVAGRKVFTAATVGIAGSPVLRASAIFVQVPLAHFEPYGTVRRSPTDLQVNP